MTARVATIGALVVAIVVVMVLVLSGGSSYTLHAMFTDAGGLVSGGRVTIAGRKVGSISRIGLTSNGLADVTLSIGDSSVTPLRVGTRAQIRALGLAGLANHYVELTPGPPSEPPIPDGGVLGIDQTQGLVSLQDILDAFGPGTRGSLQNLVANSADIFSGSGAPAFNAMLLKLDPALAALGETSTQLNGDRAALGALVHSASVATGAIAGRASQLTSALENASRAMGALADEQGYLKDALVRLPGVLQQADGTLAETDTTLQESKPALDELPPVAQPLTGLLSRARATLPKTVPVLDELRLQLPDLRKSLAGLAPLAPVARRALRSAGTAFNDSLHILSGLRIYGSDLVLGVLSSVFARVTANYSFNGNYARALFAQPPNLAFGPIAQFFGNAPLVPGVLQPYTRRLRPCAGGNAPPAPDNSNPWDPDPSLCTPSEDAPESVNQP